MSPLMGSRPTVVHVTPWFLPHIGGLERHVETICSGVNSFRSVVVTPRIPGTQMMERSSENMTVLRFGPMKFAESGTPRPLRRTRDWVGRVARLANLRLVLRDLKYEVLHVHRPPLIELAYVASRYRGIAPLREISRKANVTTDGAKPTVLTDHGLFVQPSTSSSLDITWFMEDILSNFDHVICVDRSGFERASSISARLAAPFSKVHHIPQPIDTRIFQPTPLPDTRGLVVGYTGRWERDGMYLLADLVAANIPGVRFLISGGATQKDIRTYQPTFSRPNVTLAPNIVPVRELANLYRGMHILVDFYRGDGCGRSVLEAMATGRPVLRMRAQDTHPVVHGETGLLVEPDGRVIARAIAELSQRREYLAELGRNAGKAVQAEFGLDRVLPQIESVYKAALAGAEA